MLAVDGLQAQDRAREPLPDALIAVAVREKGKCRVPLDGFRSVADWALSDRLLLASIGGSKEEPRRASVQPLMQPLIRDWGSVGGARARFHGRLLSGESLGAGSRSRSASCGSQLLGKLNSDNSGSSRGIDETHWSARRRSGGLLSVVAGAERFELWLEHCRSGESALAEASAGIPVGDGPDAGRAASPTRC